jgi:ketosteroid isomerase-like protein
MSTQSVLDRHLQAFGDGDVEAAVADYAEDSIFISPRGAVLGAAAMRPVFEELFSGLFKPGTYEFTMDKVTVEGDLAVIVWHATGEAADVAFGTDTFVIRDEKIVRHTFAGQITPK